jgi:hypothetical protein
MLVIGTPEPGKKSIAQGELKVVTSVTLNGLSEVAWADCDGVALHAPSRRNRLACIKRRLIRTVPLT